MKGKYKEARAGHEYNISKKHRERESEGMKEAMEHSRAHSHHAKVSHHLHKAHEALVKAHEAAAGRKYNESAKHRKAESRGMKGK